MICQFCSSSPKPAFSFIDFAIVSFISYFFSDLYNLFPSTNFGRLFVLLSLVALGVSLGCLLDVFLVGFLQFEFFTVFFFPL